MTAQNGLPPIIDREIIFGNPEIAGAQISPNGKFISFLKPLNGVRNIWVKEIKASFDSAKPLTADKDRPIAGYFWSRDGSQILYVQDKAGDENYHVYSVDPLSNPADDSLVPESIDLTPVDGVRAFIMSVPKSKPGIMYVGINDRDKAWHDLYELEISSGKRRLVRENKEKLNGSYFDLADELRLASRSTDNGGTEILKLVDGEYQVVYSCNSLETCFPVRFKDENSVYIVTNKGEVNLTQLGILNLENNELEIVESDPKNEVDFGGTVFSDLNDELIATSYVADKTRVYWKDKSFEADYNFLKAKLAGAEINFSSSTKDEEKWIVFANKDTDPGAAYLFDRKSKELVLLYKSRPKLPIEYLSEMKAIRFSSSDGLEIPAYLTLPKGLEPSNLPTIVFPHGGPWARDNWGYNPFAQYLANRGYAVIQPNFRGSTGFGKAFLNAANNEWGQKMQDDLTWAAKYLVEKGIADPEKIGIMGGSYGGYATLAGLTFTPDVYAAGVSIVGPSNLFTLLETIPPYWETIRELFHQRMGNPETVEGREQLRRQSPLFHASNIKVPLLVAQGANDPRVKKAESDQIVLAMRELGLDVQYMNFPDEGHGFANPDNNMAFLAKTEKFLSQHLGGRHQDDIPDRLQKIIDKVSVDIKTVKMPEKISEEMSGAALPVPEMDLIAREDKFNMTIEMAGQNIPMELTRSVSREGTNWTVIDKVITPMGEILDKTVLSTPGLLPVSRKMEQGPIQIDLNYSLDKIEGTMSMNGKENPVSIALKAPVFGDGAALAETLSSLPLSEGYQCIYRVFDPNTQEVTPFRMKVSGTEKLTISSASVESFVLDIISLDGNDSKQKMWISTGANRKMIKMTTNRPDMGGAKITLLLQD